jgi:hypothetical protein
MLCTSYKPSNFVTRYGSLSSKALIYGLYFPPNQDLSATLNLQPFTHGRTQAINI